MVRVNAASFRAVSEVRAIRGQSSAALEFVRLSAGGKYSLSGLVTDLARLQAIMNKLKSVRREMNDEAFRKELKKKDSAPRCAAPGFLLWGSRCSQRLRKFIWSLCLLKRMATPNHRHSSSP